MKNSATISGDIVSYTALSYNDKRKLENSIWEMFTKLSEKYRKGSFFGRLIKGDAIEIAMQRPKYILRVALMLKALIKSFEFNYRDADQQRLKYFREHGLRLAIAVAPLTTLDTEKGIIDGDAIYLSGRKIKDMNTFNKQKIIIKNTMFFCSPVQKKEEYFDALISLLDAIFSQCSAKQCEVLYHKLSGLSERETSKTLNKSQSTISQHSNAAGWHAIEKTVTYFEKYIS